MQNCSSRVRFPLLAYSICDFRIRVADCRVNPKSAIPNPKSAWLCSSMDLERLSSEQKVAGSNPAEAVTIEDFGNRNGNRKIQNPKSPIQNHPGGVAQRNQSVSLRKKRLKVRILPSPFFRLRSSTESEHKSSKLEVAGSNPAEAFSYRSRLMAGRIALNDEISGSNPFSGVILTTKRSADGYTDLFWKQVFAGSNPAA